MKLSFPISITCCYNDHYMGDLVVSKWFGVMVLQIGEGL